jgi:hypothetical protein
MTKQPSATSPKEAAAVIGCLILAFLAGCASQARFENWDYTIGISVGVFVFFYWAIARRL